MSEKKGTRPTYNDEFKAEAVSKCLKIGINKASKELGVASSTLHGWMSKSTKTPQSGRAAPSYAELERENYKLKKELSYVNEINKVLKKSTAIFSNSEMGGLR